MWTIYIQHKKTRQIERVCTMNKRLINAYKESDSVNVIKVIAPQYRYAIRDTGIYRSITTIYIMTAMQARSLNNDLRRIGSDLQWSQL